MNLPARYPYDPRWQLVAMGWVYVSVLTVASLVSGLYFPWALGIWVGMLAFFAIFVMLATLRRRAFPRHLVVDEDGVWIPEGFLTLNVRRVVFVEVSEVWEEFVPLTAIFCIRSQGKTCRVLSTQLLDHETYLELAGYLYSRLMPSDA